MDLNEHSFNSYTAMRKVSENLAMRKDYDDGIIYFRFESNRALKDWEAVELQKLKGYHPCGYGFGGLKVENWKSIGIVTTWNCSTSCR